MDHVSLIFALTGAVNTVLYVCCLLFVSVRLVTIFVGERTNCNETHRPLLPDRIASKYGMRVLACDVCAFPLEFGPKF